MPGYGIDHEEHLRIVFRIEHKSGDLIFWDPFRRAACGLDMLFACRTANSNVHVKRRHSRDRSEHRLLFLLRFGSFGRDRVTSTKRRMKISRLYALCFSNALLEGFV